jgi:hypothetical protein
MCFSKTAYSSFTNSLRAFLLLLFVGAGWCFESSAQELSGDQAVYSDGKARIPLTDELQFGVMMHTQGGGVTVRKGKYKGAFRITWFGADLILLKHPKEIKISNPIYENGRSYVYGKQNAFHMLRLWRGHQRLRSEKLRKDAVQLSTHWRYGFTLGILKPVYLEIGYPDIPYDYIDTEVYDASAHFSDNIYGQASWSNGLDELAVVPGLHLSYGLDFEYGNERFEQRTLSAGIACDAFVTPPEIFAAGFEQNHRLFVTLFATFEVGRNWLR